VGPAGGVAPDATADRAFVDLPSLVPDDAVVIVNDTRVVPARVRTHKELRAGAAPGQGGGFVEVLFVEPAAAPGTWRCLVRPQKSLRAGTILRPDAAPATALTVVDPRAADGAAIISLPGDLLAFLDAAGELPLPPYIERDPAAPEPADRDRYQTVFARDPGAIAAPTAGLHFTPAVVDALAARGCTLATVTLHVGLGTFSPVREDDLAAHVMHRERYDVPAATAALIASGRPVVAVGTTVVRTLEAAAIGPRQVAAGPGDTALFIRPGIDFRFRVVDHLLTNFHLPESTLLMLVSAFAGYDRIRAAYAHAVAAGYRFFSYGDAMLLTRAP
jgi:S-adenosylmethionine:tRNA ribosyltransferase-isomerase